MISILDGTLAYKVQGETNQSQAVPILFSRAYGF